MSDTEKKKIVVGVDPGLNGGIAVMELGHIGEVVKIDVIRMPTKPGPAGRRDVDGLKVSIFLDHCCSGEKVVLAAVESVHSFHKQGVVSAFNFGKSYGKLLGIIEALGMPLDEPTPQQWQKLVLAGMQTKKKSRGKGKSGADRRDKDTSIRYVLNHFPSVNLKATEKSTTNHDGIAEAVCLAEYARRVILQPMGGRLPQENAP